MSVAASISQSSLDEHPPMASALTPDFNRLENTPHWFQQRVKSAWDEFLAAPLPGNRDEAWRYSSAKSLVMDSWQLVAEASEADRDLAISKSEGLEQTSAKLVFLNDRLIQNTVGELANGVVCLPFAEALISHGDVLEQYLMKRKAELGSAKFAALHLAHVTAGAVILAPKNAVLLQPIEIFHWVSGENSVVFPHTLIVTGEHAQVTVIDHHRSLRDEAAQSVAVADFVAGNGSRITYVTAQELSHSARALHISSTTVSKDAEVKVLQLELGAAFCRSESVSDLIGEGARSEMLGVTVPFGTQVADMRTLQNHVAPHTYSDLLYKNALYGKTRTIFSGLINVADGAHYTDAYQKCRNLLNSDDAEAVSMPGLEINADQVKCSHGATSAPISEDELFYLKARGIPDKESRHLITVGFLEDVIAKLDHQPALVEFLDRRIEGKFDLVG